MKKLVRSLAVLGFAATTAFGHFQMLYTPESALEKGSTIELRHVFTHPFADEHTMDMAGVESFYAINKERMRNLKPTLESINFIGNHNSGKRYQSTYKARKMGDHVFVMVPTPYFEKNEDACIQQITKTVVNVAGAPTDWDAELGLKAEIVPPY